MKRAASALVMLGIVAASAAPSMAGTPVYGSAQLKYTVNATAAISIAVNYSNTGAIQNATASTILASAAGNCSAGVAEGANATLTFGGITPPASGYTSCYYKNAVSVGINSNDSAGVKLVEYVDAIPTNTVYCAYPTDATPKAAPTQSSATAIAGGGTCAAATGGVAGTALTALGATTAGTGFGAAGTPPVSTNVTATPTATTYTSGGFTVYSTASAPPAGWNFLGQDVSVNVNAAANSGAQTQVITFALIPS